jgi:hypothetical protein
VGITVYVFDERVALTHGEAQVDYSDWIRGEIDAAPKDGGWNKPKSSSLLLRKWFEDMRKSFPLLRDAHPDDSYGTEYCFYKNVIETIFASSVGEEGILQAWRLAGKYGVRLLVGDELLPRTAPKGERDFHISVLDGRRLAPASIVPNMCFIVFDPDVEHVAPKKARTWILERLEAGPWSKDRSTLMGDRLRQWAAQFAVRNLDGLISEMRFYRDIIFTRVDKKNDNAMLSPVMELSHKLDLPFKTFVDLD